jgi:hypothetical protein
MVTEEQRQEATRYAAKHLRDIAARMDAGEFEWWAYDHERGFRQVPSFDEWIRQEPDGTWRIEIRYRETVQHPFGALAR